MASVAEAPPDGAEGSPIGQPRIAHVLSQLFRSGDAKVRYSLVRGLSGDCSHVVIYQQDPPGTILSEIEELADVRRCAYPRGKPWQFLSACVKTLREEAPDIMLAHVFGNHLLVSLAARIAGVPRRLVVVAGEPDHYCGKRWRAILLAHLARPFCSGEIAVSEEVGRSLREDLGLPRRRIFVIPNGCDVDEVARCAGQGRGRRSDESRQSLLMVAQLREAKDHPTLFRAMRQLISSGRELELWLAGDGPRKSELEAMVERLGLSGYIHFLGNRVDVPELMGASDLLVLATQTEGLPLVLLEGMAAGTPIVATDVPGCREALDRGRCGLLVPPGDAIALAAAIVKLLDDFALCSRLTSAARERVSGRYRVEHQVKRYADLLLRSW